MKHKKSVRRCFFISNSYTVSLSREYKVCQEKINNLTQNFNYYLSAFSNGNRYCGPSIYFHNRIMDILQTTPLNDLLNSVQYSEYIYSVLTSWGMHRMDRGAQLKNFPEFHDVISIFIQNLIPLSQLQISEIEEDNILCIVNLFENYSVMRSGRKLVGNSKTLHHILPNLIPPIDGRYTIKFFNLTNNHRSESENFKYILNKYKNIFSLVNWNAITYNGLMNTTKIKLIDNAIIGYANSQNIFQ